MDKMLAQTKQIFCPRLDGTHEIDVARCMVYCESNGVVRELLRSHKLVAFGQRPLIVQLVEWRTVVHIITQTSIGR